MSEVQLNDVIDIKIFEDLPALHSPEKTAYFQSGIVISNPLLDSIANQPGRLAELPFWLDLNADDEPNYSSDDPTEDGQTSKMSQTSLLVRKAFLNRGFSTMDLVAELANSDPMTAIRNRVDMYWLRQWQRRLINATLGVYYNNIKAAVSGGNDSDMVFDVAAGINSAVTDNTKFSRENFTSAVFTMGDYYNQLSAIAVHSVVYKNMVDADAIDFMPDSTGQLTIPTYLGLRIIVDDSMPYTPAGGTDPGDDAPKYTSVIFGQGAFGFASGEPAVPVEIDRLPSKGHGAGQSVLWVRKNWIIQPAGYSIDAAPAGETYTLNELKADDTFKRVFERKQVPLAFLVTNG